MHHFKHFRHSWCRSRAMAYAATPEPLHMETRGHHRHGGSASFGVRRPLRYLSYQLDLDDSQTRKVAGILNRLKTEREQAALDQKRTVSSLADLLTGEEPLDEELRTALEPRLKSAERLQREVGNAIKEMYRVLDQDQRLRLADLLTSGSIAI